MTSTAVQKSEFYTALTAPGRSPEIAESADVYGRLMGSWELDVYDNVPDGTMRRAKGEVHFCWVLEGRAVEDVWIIPPCSERTADIGKAGNRYGFTIRVWDPSIEAWRVTWINPVTGARDELVGRRSGNDIVQEGHHSDGTPIRWNFTDITADSFRWLGESLNPDGATWKLDVEFRAKRIPASGR